MTHLFSALPTAGRFALILGVLSGGAALAAEAGPSAEFSVVWRRPGELGEQALKAFSGAELQALKLTSAREKRPGSDRPLEWKGPLFSVLLEEAMKELSAESRSQIDLVILRGAQGEVAWIPRSFLGRYGMILAIPGRHAVVPSASRSKLQTEDLPHGTYWVKGVRRVELTSYREQFGQFYLKRRTDPAAMRGEKVFIQNCMACHAGSSMPASWHGDSLAALIKKHPPKSGYQAVSEKTGKALSVYWQAYRTEQTEKR